jgi:hypothetical protein
MQVMSAPWRASKENEGAKLAPKENDWNLAGLSTPPQSRTRHGGIRPDKRKRRHLFGDDSSSSESSYSEMDVSSEDSDGEEEGEEWNDRKPSETRVIIEKKPVIELIEKCTKCPMCGGSVSVSFNTITVATSLSIECNSKECSFVEYGGTPARATLPQYQDDNYERNTNYAINVLYVLAFMSNGSGAREACRFLGFLGLPNDTTMETRSFSTIEERIAPVLWSVWQEIMRENLIEEIKRSTTAEKFILWKQSIDTNQEYQLPKKEYINLSVSYDMGWNQRGNMRNSPSGQGCLVGKHTRKAILAVVKSKLCCFCSAWQTKVEKKQVEEGANKPDHYCLRNHLMPSSGSMEPDALLEMVTDLHERWHCNAEFICMDDDSSTRQIIR